MDPARFPWSPGSDDESPLFLQRAGRTMLIGYREQEQWVLARGWRTGDRFTDIRHWRFDAPSRFVAQVNRLVREADTAAPTNDAALAAERWVRAALPS